MYRSLKLPLGGGGRVVGAVVLGLEEEEKEEGAALTRQPGVTRRQFNSGRPGSLYSIR